MIKKQLVHLEVHTFQIRNKKFVTPHRAHFRVTIIHNHFVFPLV